MIEQTDNFESNFNYDNITFEHKEAIKAQETPRTAARAVPPGVMGVG